MNGKTFTTVVWVLLGLLVIAAAALTNGENDQKTFPSSSSYRPSGTRAFVQILRDLGYSVTVGSARIKPINNGETVIAYQVGSTFPSSNERQLLVDNWKSGGNVIVLGLPKTFPALPQSSTVNQSPELPVVTTANVINYAGAKRRTIDLCPEGVYGFLSATGNTFTIAETEGGVAVADLLSSRPGSLLVVPNGILATNRYIDRNDNAAELIHLVQTVVPPHGNILIDEASFSDAKTPGMLERLGAWAVAAWWQILALFAIIIYSLGKPFGYPDEERPRQQGARELVDAVSQTFRRARATNIALEYVVNDADSEIRKKLKLSREASRSDRNRLIPDSLRIVLTEAEQLAPARPHSDEALKLAQKVEAELSAFLGKPAPRYRRRKLSADGN